MNNFQAVQIAEGVEPADEDEVLEAWQQLIDTGLCWQRQGAFGRTAAALIDAGLCQPAGRRA
jgi:hypothetical protein